MLTKTTPAEAVSHKLVKPVWPGAHLNFKTSTAYQEINIKRKVHFSSSVILWSQVGAF